MEKKLSVSYKKSDLDQFDKIITNKQTDQKVIEYSIKEAIEDTTDKKERDEESESDVNSKTDLNEVLTDQLRDAVKRGLTKEVDIIASWPGLVGE